MVVLSVGCYWLVAVSQSFVVCLFEHWLAGFPICVGSLFRGWLVYRFVGWLVGRSDNWLVVDCSEVGWLVGLSVGQLGGGSLFRGWLVGLSVGRSVGGLSGRWVGWITWQLDWVFSPIRPPALRSLYTCSVSDQPDVWLWVLSRQDFMFFGLKFSLIRWAQSRRAALILAISM